MSAKRKAVPKHLRQGIFAKTHNRCAYCGQLLNPSTATVDHVKCLASGIKKPNAISNLLPCCIECNRKKGSLSLEQFRHVIFGKVGILHDLRENQNYQLAKSFGLIEEKPITDDKFFFEKDGSLSNEALLEDFLSGRKTHVEFRPKEEEKVQETQTGYICDEQDEELPFANIDEEDLGDFVPVRDKNTNSVLQRLIDIIETQKPSPDFIKGYLVGFMEANRE